MMKMEKGKFSVNKEALSLEMGMTKIDVARRIVSGFATVDNVDLQNDIVEFEASVNAFDRSRKNVREMHQPIAVGKIVSYHPKEYVDLESGEVYKGLFVSVYISNGAEDTWQKVLDGTLSAFSIKGPIRKAITRLIPGSDEPVRVIKDYDLEELSLVDAGGNQWANVISIQKDASGDTQVTGIATDVETKNIFWCKEDKVSTMSDSETETCPDGHDMAAIGWVESGDPDAIQKMKDMVGYFNNDTRENETTEGGVRVMAEENVVKSEEASEEVNTESQETVDTESQAEEVATEETSEEVAEAGEEEEVSEVPNDDDEIAKIHQIVSDLEKRIDTGIESNKAVITEAIDRIEKSIDTSREESEVKLNDFEQKYEEMKKSLEDISGKFDTVSKSVEAIDGSAALKKSNDLGGSEESNSKPVGLWSQSIL